jgi:cation diffusion facilitator CzcD-associated flavoprotein CzcO
MPSSGSQPTDVRIAIVGSGFAGLGTAANLKRIGIEDFVVLEREHDVGGVWRDNTYPGCQCDVPSTLYSFSFAPNPEWTHTYPLQPEIWDYLRRVAAAHGITPHIRYGHEVTAARWDEDSQCWVIEAAGEQITAQILVLGIGGLSEPSIPAIPGLDRFEGTVFHSARWNHQHDLTGERVAAIGTGASAIQFVPRIQPQVAELHLYQRTAPWIMPHSDRPVTALERRLWRAMPRSQHLSRALVYSLRESLVFGLTMRPRLMVGLETVARAHLRRQVPDPGLRRKLTPHYRLGCKRILVSNDYYPALAQPNVQVITDRVQEVTQTGLRAADGTEREVDTIVLGTGFHVTDPPSAAYVTGRGGVRLADAWRESMSAFVGTTISGFPNMFMITGPNTGLGHNSMVYMIESQIAYVIDALLAMDARGATAVDVRPEVQTQYNDELQRRLAPTVWNTGGCQSWYLDASGRNTTLWPSFTFRYRERTRAFDESDYVVSPEPPSDPLTTVGPGRVGRPAPRSRVTAST